MKEKLNTMFGDDRAVSPVIGVILMVAITVILAAVIGTFVLGLGDSLGDSQPTASFNVDVSEANNNLTIEHAGGDRIEAETLRIRLDVTGDHDDFDQQSLFIDRFEVGDSATIGYNESGTSDPAREDIRVRVIHEPSQSTLLDRTITVSNVAEDGEWEAEF